MRKHTSAAIFIIVMLLALRAHSRQNWGQLRGPDGGVASGKTAMPHGHSSPCIWGDRIFLTGVANDADGEGDHPLWGFHRFLDEDRSGKINEKEWGKMIAFLDSFKQENALLAVKPGVGDARETRVVWRHNKGVPECPSLLHHQGRIFMVKNGGIVTCLDSKTGEPVYQGRLGAGGPYYASPVAGDGKIYASSARGVVTVLEAGGDLKVLARNNLNERIMATPAIMDGKVYVRREKHVYAFGLGG